jgi:hypothetical protein
MNYTYVSDRLAAMAESFFGRMKSPTKNEFRKFYRKLCRDAKSDLSLAAFPCTYHCLNRC